MLQSKGLTLHGGVVERNEHGYIHLLIENVTAECQELSQYVTVGCISECLLPAYQELTDELSDSSNSCTEVHTVTPTHMDSDVTQRQQSLKALILMSVGLGGIAILVLDISYSKKPLFIAVFTN